MKKNIKAIIVILILLLTGVLSVFGLRAAKTYLSGAAGGTEPNGVRVLADSTSSTISWQTTKEAQGTVEYGTSPASLLLRALETKPVTTHRVVVSPLKAGTTYYFRIRVGDSVYDNNGIPYSFKTKVRAEGVETDEITSVLEPTTAVEVVTPTSIPVRGEVIKVTECVKSDFKDKFGTKDARYDLDDNGVVNTRDWIKCLQNNN